MLGIPIGAFGGVELFMITISAPPACVGKLTAGFPRRGTQSSLLFASLTNWQWLGMIQFLDMIKQLGLGSEDLIAGYALKLYGVSDFSSADFAY